MAHSFSNRVPFYAHRYIRSSMKSDPGLERPAVLERRVPHRPSAVQVLLPVPELPSRYLKGAPWRLQAHLGRVEEVQRFDGQTYYDVSLWHLPSGVGFQGMVPASIAEDSLAPGDVVFFWTWRELSEDPVRPHVLERSRMLLADHHTLTRDERMALQQVLSRLESAREDTDEP